MKQLVSSVEIVLDDIKMSLDNVKSTTCATRLTPFSICSFISLRSVHPTSPARLVRPTRSPWSAALLFSRMAEIWRCAQHSCF